MSKNKTKQMIAKHLEKLNLAILLYEAQGCPTLVNLYREEAEQFKKIALRLAKNNIDH